MSTVQATSAATSAATANAAQNSVAATEDRFLKLLVTQMRNQDPLNPMDNAQVTAQMAQLSTVSGINKLNDAVTALSSMYQSSQTLQASGMIGRHVLAEGNTLALNGGMAVGGFELTDPADKVVVSVKDAAGNVLEKIDIGSQKAGVNTFGWNGSTGDGNTVADGKYSFTVEATLSGAKISATPLALGAVGSVTLGSQGISLNTDVLGSLSISQLKQIL
jgi:flagellar basal-body rod modification protein FlgD